MENQTEFIIKDENIGEKLNVNKKLYTEMLIKSQIFKQTVRYAKIRPYACFQIYFKIS